MRMSQSTKKIARLSVLTALGAVFLLLANVLPAGRLALLAVSSFPVCMALLMYGRGWATGVYILISILGMLIFPGTAAIAFAAFFGYYPVLKSILERMHNTTLVWVLKYALYAIVFALYWFLASRMLLAEASAMPVYLLALGGAVAFYVYDRCYSMLIQFYLQKIARYFP